MIAFSFAIVYDQSGRKYADITLRPKLWELFKPMAKQRVILSYTKKKKPQH